MSMSTAVEAALGWRCLHCSTPLSLSLPLLCLLLVLLLLSVNDALLAAPSDTWL